MTFWGKLLLLILLVLNSNFTFGQDSLLIKGYVIANDRVQPDVQVSVAHKNKKVYTDFKGRFKIYCSINDTLIFEKKDSKLKIEKYVVKDHLPVIIELINEKSVNEKGRYTIYGSISEIGRMMPKISFAGSVIDKNIFSLRYNFFPYPFFPDKPYIPILNAVSFGLNLTKNNNSYYFFPNIGFYIKNSYQNIFDSGFSFSFLKPSVNIGYWINDLKVGKNGLGYELWISLFDFSFQFRRNKLFSIDLKYNYNNYPTPHGSFMLGITYKETLVSNDIPKFIKKQISK
jgi:hypothetical protein